MTENITENMTEGKPNKVKLNVIGLDNTLTQFIIKDTTPFGKMMMTYCELKGLDVTLIRFLYEGKRLQEISTCHGEKIPDNATIETYQKQGGGNVC